MSEALLWNEIGTLYQKMGLLEESIQAFLKALEQNPDSAQSNSNLAHSYFQRKEYGHAISLYRKIIPLLKTAQEQSAAWNKIGDAYRAMKDLDNAFAAYHKADELEMQPVGLPAYAPRSDQKVDEDPVPLESSTPGSALTAVKQDNPAPADPEEIVVLQDQSDPSNTSNSSSPGHNNEKSASQTMDPSLEEVLAKVSVYEKITQANPTNHRAWDTLGKLYKSLGRYQDAIHAYKHAIECAPQFEHYHYYLGLLYAVEQQQEDAIQAFENVLRLNSEYILAHSALAGIYHRLGMVAKANLHIAAALPKMNEESSYNRACFYAICGDVELSIEFLRLALENDDTTLEWIKTDPDLEPIRKDERYRELILEFEDPSRHTPGGNYFSSELNGTNNQLLPLLNNSLAR